MEDDIGEGTVDMQSAVFVVVNEVQFAEFIHEETEAGARALLLVSG